MAGRLAPLLFEARYVALLISAIAASTVALLRFPSEPHVRWSGTALISIGFALVFLQLKSISSEFNHPSLAGGFLEWLKRVGLALHPPPPRVLQASGTAIGVGSGSARLDVTRAHPDLATLIADLRRDFEDQRVADDARHRALVERIDREGAAHLARTSELESAQSGLVKRVEELAVGDVFTAFIGLALSVVGTLEAGFAPEIACWLR